jgi:hypothetical protein
VHCRRSALNAPDRVLTHTHTLSLSLSLSLSLGAPAPYSWWFMPNRSVSGVRKYFREGGGHLPIWEKDDRIRRNPK